MYSNILIVNTDKPVCCLNLLEKENLWKVRHVNINKAKEVINSKYIDLICLELNTNKDSTWQFLIEIRNKRLKKKILSIIPNNRLLKEKGLSDGSDDYLCKP